MIYTTPMRLTRCLITKFNNGTYKVSLDSVCKDLFGTATVITLSHKTEVMRVWRPAETHCRNRDLCVIPVTQFYLDNFPKMKIEPSNPKAINQSIAGGLWNKNSATAGFRMLSMKGSKNDPMAVEYLQRRIRCVRGGEAAILDRITVEWMRGALTKTLAKQLVDKTSAPALPPHEAEFEQLMK